MFRPISIFPDLNTLEIVNELFPFQHLESLFNNKDIKIFFLVVTKHHSVSTQNKRACPEDPPSKHAISPNCCLIWQKYIIVILVYSLTDSDGCTAI